MPERQPEYRRIQLMGRSSYAVTLPKSWVRQHNLSSGSTVAVTVDPKGVLHIYPEGMEREREELSEKVLDASRIPSPGALAEAIRSCYKIGYETIVIRHPGGISPEGVAEIHEAVNSLYGTLIVSESANETVLRTSIDVKTLPVQSLLNRMGSFFLYLAREVENVLKTGSTEEAKAVEYRASEAEKIYSLLVRQLVQGVRSHQIAFRVGLKDVIQCLGSRMVSKALIDMTRGMLGIYHVSPEIHDRSGEYVDTVLSLLIDVIRLYRKAFAALQQEDIRKAAEVLADRSQFHERLTSFEKTLPKGEEEGSKVSPLVSALLELQNVNNSIAVLAEVAVNRYVEGPEAS